MTIFEYSGLNRYAKSLSSTRIKIDLGDRYEKTSQSEQGVSFHSGPRTLDEEVEVVEGEGRL